MQSKDKRMDFLKEFIKICFKESIKCKYKLIRYCFFVKFIYKETSTNFLFKIISIIFYDFSSSFGQLMNSRKKFSRFDSIIDTFFNIVNFFKVLISQMMLKRRNRCKQVVIWIIRIWYWIEICALYQTYN